MSFRSEFGKFSGNGMGSINQNPLAYSIFSGTNGASPAAPIINDWSLWNSSADIPFVSLGAASNIGSDVSISTVKIDATRFLLISGGYYNVFSSAYIPATVVVGTLTGGEPTYGTPVNLDTDTNGSTGTFFKSAHVSDGKVYIYYSWYDSPAQVSFAKICNVALDGTISFGTRSAQIGLSAGLNSAVPHGLTLDSDGIHPYHLYRDSGTNNLFLIATTINIDDTITVGTPKDTGLQSSVGNISTFRSGEIFFTNGNTAYVAPSIGATIGNIAATLTFDNDVQGCAVARLNDSQMMVVYVNFGSNYDFKAVVVTYHRSGFSLSKGTVTQFDTIDGAAFAGMLEAIAVNNTAQQIIATYFINPGDQLIAGVRAVCLTPSGTNISASTYYQINANLLNYDFFYVNMPQSVAMSETIIVSPYTSYDNVSFGVTVLNQVNAFTFPHLIFDLDADNTSQSTGASLGNATGTSGASTFVVAGVDLTATLVADTYVILNNVGVYIVASSSYNGSNTIVTITDTLSTNYSGVTTKLLILPQWDDSSSNAYVFAPAGTSRPQIGFTHGHRTIIFTTNAADAYLSNSAISFAMNSDATLFIVAKINSGFACGSTAAGLESLLDVASTSVNYVPSPPPGAPYSVGSYNATTGLTLITVVRSYGITSVYINGVFNQSGTVPALAIGDPLKFILGNNSTDSSPLLGEISYARLYNGAMSGASLTNENNFFLDRFGII